MLDLYRSFVYLSSKLIPVDIVKVDEPWAEAFLANGDVVRAKLVFNHILMHMSENDKPIIDTNGAHIYQVTNATIVITRLKSQKNDYDKIS